MIFVVSAILILFGLASVAIAIHAEGRAALFYGVFALGFFGAVFRMITLEVARCCV